MNKTDRDKFLIEQLGECWHDFSYPNNCVKCNKQIQDLYFIDFSTWSGFGKLWEWAQKQEWWRSFEHYCDLNRGVFLNTMCINPDRFANAVYNYLKEKP